MALKGTEGAGGAGGAFGEVRARGGGVERPKEDTAGGGEYTCREGEGDDPSTSADEKHWRRTRRRPRPHHVPRALTMAGAACAAPSVKGSKPPYSSCLHGARGSSAAWGLHDVLGAPGGGCLEQRAPLLVPARCTRSLVWRQPYIARLIFS